MQNRYIDNLQKEFNELEKTHKELHHDFSITIGDLNTSIENLEIKVLQVQDQNNLTMKEVRKND